MNKSTFQGNGKVTYVPVIVNGKQAKQTNADRIRNMSDEELAKFVTMVHGNGLLGTRPTNGWLDWLRQESADKEGEA